MHYLKHYCLAVNLRCWLSDACARRRVPQFGPGMSYKEGMPQWYEQAQNDRGLRFEVELGR